MARLRGTDADDTLTAHHAGDWLQGKGGDDLLIATDGGNDLQGGIGVDTLIGGKGNDYLSAGNGDPSQPDGTPGDSIEAGAGDDYITSGTGDLVSAGDGDDIVWAVAGEGGVFDGGAGRDFINIKFVTDTPYTGDAAFLDGTGDLNIDGATVRGFERGYLTLGGGDDVLSGGAHAGVWSFNGGLGDDHLVGKGHADWLEGGGGSDTLEGGGGDDFLSGDDASLVLGQDGDDRLGSGFDDHGVTTLIGGAGDDTIQGGGLLEGGDGADRLTAGDYEFSGATTLRGGAGADTYIFGSIYASSAKEPALIQDKSIAVVNFHGIDANSQTYGPNEAFKVVDALHGTPGEMTIIYDAADNITRVSGDVNGDGQADLMVLIKGDYSDPAGFVL